MTRENAKPRTMADILREMRERVAALPTPKPPQDAPRPPPSHHDPEDK